MAVPELSCVISGSFTKAKPRIDRAIDCFENNSIKVLSPQKGGLYYPEPSSGWGQGAYPLAAERSFSESQAKINHVRAIGAADFLYVVAPDGYIGESVGFEVGIANAFDIPIYSDEPIDPALEAGPNWDEHIKIFQVKSPEEVALIWKDVKKPAQGLWLPRWYAFELYE